MFPATGGNSHKIWGLRSHPATGRSLLECWNARKSSIARRSLRDLNRARLGQRHGGHRAAVAGADRSADPGHRSGAVDQFVPHPGQHHHHRDRDLRRPADGLRDGPVQRQEQSDAVAQHAQHAARSRLDRRADPDPARDRDPVVPAALPAVLLPEARSDDQSLRQRLVLGARVPRRRRRQGDVEHGDRRGRPRSRHRQGRVREALRQARRHRASRSSSTKRRCRSGRRPSRSASSRSTTRSRCRSTRSSTCW